MPDTMIPPQHSDCGVMDRYRSPAIGKLVGARAKAVASIKKIIKDKSATIPTKTGGAGYKYRYADLADVIEAVEDGLAGQGLALFQTTQDRDRATYLVTTLAHESDQWISSEIRLKSADQGPQVYGSEMTYLRRYSVLALLSLAPDQDDDGRAAQDRHAPTARPQPPPERESPMISLSLPGDAPPMNFPKSRAGVGAALAFMAQRPESVLLNLGLLDAVAEKMPDFSDRVAEVRAAAAKALAPATQEEIDRENIEDWPGASAGAEKPQPAGA